MPWIRMRRVPAFAAGGLAALVLCAGAGAGAAEVPGTGAGGPGSAIAANSGDTIAGAWRVR